MTPNEWAAVLGSMLATITAVYSAMRFMIKAVLRELQPNGGAMKDQVNRIELRLDHLYTILVERHDDS